jgi:hypothetical protein
LGALLDTMERKGTGVKFPTVLNMAVTLLLDQLDAGASIIFDGNGFRLAHFEVLPAVERKSSAVVHLDKPDDPPAEPKKKKA